MNRYRVIIPSSMIYPPRRHELSAAVILAQHFKTDVIFITPTKHKTADFLIGNQRWELKSPTGSGKRTIQHALYAALKQSPNIIFDARHSGMRQDKIKRDLQLQFTISHAIHRLLLITRDNQVIVLTKQG